MSSPKPKFTPGFAVFTAEFVQSGILHKLKHRHLLVLIAALSFAPNIRCSHKALTKLTGLSRGTVRRALGELDHLGILCIAARRGSYGQLANEYTPGDFADKALVDHVLTALEHEEIWLILGGLYSPRRDEVNLELADRFRWQLENGQPQDGADSVSQCSSESAEPAPCLPGAPKPDELSTPAAASCATPEEESTETLENMIAELSATSCAGDQQEIQPSAVPSRFVNVDPAFHATTPRGKMEDRVDKSGEFDLLVYKVHASKPDEYQPIRDWISTAGIKGRNAAYVFLMTAYKRWSLDQLKSSWITVKANKEIKNPAAYFVKSIKNGSLPNSIMGFDPENKTHVGVKHVLDHWLDECELEDGGRQRAVKIMLGVLCVKKEQQGVNPLDLLANFEQEYELSPGGTPPGVIFNAVRDHFEELAGNIRVLSPDQLRREMLRKNWQQDKRSREATRQAQFLVTQSLGSTDTGERKETGSLSENPPGYQALQMASCSVE